MNFKSLKPSVKLVVAMGYLLLSLSIYASSLERYDFGSVDLGGNLSHEFTWKNSGKTPMVIENIQSSCSCVEISDFSRVIAPNSSVKIPIKFTSHKPGAVNVTIAVKLANEPKPSERFLITGMVKDVPLVSLKKEYLASGNELAELKHLNDVSFIDIRPASSYREAHIPGSINLPLFSIKTKNFLKSKKLVLVDDSIVAEDALRESKRLKDQNFSFVKVLDGGIRAWKLSGGSLEGETPLSLSSAKISPSDLYEEKGDENCVLVLFGFKNDQTWKISMPVQSIEFCGSKQFAAKLQDILSEKKSVSKIIIATKYGEAYASLESEVQKLKCPTTFYLEGGMEGYKQFLTVQDHLKDRRVMTVASNPPGKGKKGCSTCP